MIARIIKQVSGAGAFDASQAAQLLALAAAIGLIAFNLQYHYRMLISPVPLDVFENAMPFITGLLAQGGNPFRFENQPLYTMVYPPLYNLLSVPAAALFGNSLVLHRAVAGLLLLACVGLVYRAARAEGCAPGWSVAAAALFYTALLYNNTPVASTNSTGLCFFLLAIILPRLNAWSNSSLCVSAVCGLLAFYGKQYFLIAPAILSIYLFLFVSRGRAVAYAAGFAALLLGSIVVVHISSPYYFDNTVFAVRAAAGITRVPGHMLEQIRLFAMIYGGLIAAAGAGHFIKLRKTGGNWRRCLTPGYYSMMLLAGTLTILMLAQNRGNHMTYLFHLMTPFVLIPALGVITQQRHTQWLALPLVLWTGWQSWQLLPVETEVDLANWQSVAAQISQHETIYSDPLFLHSLREHDKRIYNGPLEEWFYFALIKPRWLQREDPQRSIRGITDLHVGRINDMIAAREFELIILRKGKFGIIGAAREGFPFATGDQLAAFHANYRVYQELSVPMPRQRKHSSQRITLYQPRDSAD